MHKHWDFLSIRASSRSRRIFRYKGTEGGTTANATLLVCTESVRQPSAICTKLGIPTAFRLPRLPPVPHALRGKVS
ncbi:hypothetical protein [Bacteroides caccae]|uniref:hypothetical protein n=1 Tax=Bacteroides caccae TaxID=47678 RepID=UPI0012F94969|nr:hypothetical protein [Bacteroides caccae]